MDPTKNKGYVDADYLSMGAELLSDTKKRIAALMRISPGHAVLDVGCGPGTDTIGLARRVGRSGRVIGVDHDPEMISLAEAKAREAGVEHRVRHLHANAEELPFPDDSFDATRSERMFQHLENPGAVFDAMVRVTKPGGRIVVLDPDWGTSSIDTPGLEDIERRLAAYWALRGFNNGFAGRTLRRHFSEHDVEITTLEPITFFVTDYGFHRRLILMDPGIRQAIANRIINESEADAFTSALEKLDAAGAYFASVTGTLIAGRCH